MSMRTSAMGAILRLIFIGLLTGIAFAVLAVLAARTALGAEPEAERILRRVIETPAGTHVCMIFKGEGQPMPMGAVSYDYEVLGCWPQTPPAPAVPPQAPQAQGVE